MPFVLRVSWLALCSAILLLGSCNQRPGRSATQAEQPQGPLLKVALLSSDLGLGDGAWVRECDAELDALDRAGLIEYQRVGDLPQALVAEAGAGDVGLPTEGGINPGDMTVAEASALLADVPECDWLVLTAPQLTAPALSLIKAGELSANAVLVMDEQGWSAPEGDFATPIYRFRYDIRHIAFLTGVAAAGSSVNGHAVVLVADDDPQADDFFNAAEQGVKYDKNNAWVERVDLQVDPETGIVSGAGFKESIVEMRREAGSHFMPTDYIVAAGRATPSAMTALTSDPWNGYVQGAYADYCAVRPAKVIGCGLKKPGAALAWVINQVADGQSLEQLAPNGVLQVGLAEKAIGYTAFDSYQSYNEDGIDIENSVNDVWGLIQVDELGIDY